MYRLVFITGPLKGKRMTVRSGEVRIGRAHDCQICLQGDARAAPRHAIIDDHGGGPAIHAGDEDAVLIVNQQPVREHRLRHGDRIEIGETIVEYTVPETTKPSRQRHRFSKMQAVSFIAIGLVILLQVMFVVFFPIWQKKETVPVVIPPKPAPLPVPAAPPPAQVVETPPPQEAVPSAEKPAETPIVAEVPAPPAQPPALDLPPELVLPETRPAPAVKPAADPLLEDAQKLLAQARRQAREGNLVQADNVLHRIQLISPDFLPAWQERALLYEQRGMYREATEQWRRVMALAAGTSEFDKASAERDRVSNLAERRQALQEPAPVRAPAADAPARRIRIVSVDRERFQAEQDYDEMRILRITLRPQAVEGAINSDRVRVVVQFFDRVEGTDRLVPTGALTLTDGLKITGPWPPGEARTINASYVLTRGFRADELARTGERRTYEGYRVTLFYNGELQDDSAMPRRLLNLAPPRAPR